MKPSSNHMSNDMKVIAVYLVTFLTKNYEYGPRGANEVTGNIMRYQDIWDAFNAWWTTHPNARINDEVAVNDVDNTIRVGNVTARILVAQGQSVPAAFGNLARMREDPSLTRAPKNGHVDGAFLQVLPRN